MRFGAALLLLVSLSLTIGPAASAAPYTDHYGAWTFTGPGAASVAQGPPLYSVLLRLADGTGFSVFVPLVHPDVQRPLAPTLAQLGIYRPPMLKFECYSDLGTGNLFVGQEKTQVAGPCTQTLEEVDGELRFVVRFSGDVFPVQGFGVYCVRAAPQTC